MSDTQPERRPTATGAFQEVSERFMKLYRHDRGGLRLGVLAILKHTFKHPIRTYATLLHKDYLTHSNNVLLAPFFPLTIMLEFLGHLSESELKSVKALSEVNLRRAKAVFTESPVFKVTLPLGAAYASLEVSTTLVATSGPSLDLLRTALNSPFVQRLTGSFLAGVILGLILISLEYVFLTVPIIARAQLLDDILLIALEEKRLSMALTDPHSNTAPDGRTAHAAPLSASVSVSSLEPTSTNRPNTCSPTCAISSSTHSS
jgi:hypothetical protein